MSKFEIGQKVKITNYPAESYNGLFGVITNIVVQNDFTFGTHYYVKINDNEFHDIIRLFENEIEAVEFTEEEQYVQYVNAYLDRKPLKWSDFTLDLIGVGVAAIVLVLIAYLVKVG